MSLIRGISAVDSPSIDAFSRWRVSQPQSIFESQFQYDLQPLIWEQLTATSGAVAHLPNESSAQLTVTGTSGSLAALQTFEYFRYQPLKSQLLAMTVVMGAATANVRKRLGQFDAGNGLFLEQNGTTDVALVRRTYTSGTAVDNRVVQAAWNIDPLTGSGPSGLTLDLSKAQILLIDYQWLGVGRVRVSFDIDGVIVPVHEFLHANVLTTVYTQTMNLPLRGEVESTAASAGASMKMICAALVSEGGIDNVNGYHHEVEGSVTAASGARTHVLSVQPRLTFNSLTNRMKFTLEHISILVTGNRPIYWELCFGAALTGTTTFNDANPTYSGMAYNTAGTLSGSPAITALSGYVASSATAKGDIAFALNALYPITLDAAGAVRTLGRATILVTGIGGASACQVTAAWHENR